MLQRLFHQHDAEPMPGASPGSRRIFELFLIKPSHYDDDGYIIQWARSSIPSNSLAILHGLALDCAERQVLGADVEIRITAWDETNTRIVPLQIVDRIRAAGGRGLVGLVGVQSNQFPRAIDLAARFREAGIQVAVGGFHVSGCLAMLPELPPDLEAARFADLRIPLINNWQAREIRAGHEAREGLYQQVPNPVRWTDTIRYLAAHGVERWFEAGAGTVLSGLLGNIVAGARCTSFGEAKDLEKLRSASFSERMA